MTTIKTWLKTRMHNLLGLPQLNEGLQHVRGDIQALIEQQIRLNHHIRGEEDLSLKHYLQELVSESKPGSVFTCCINGIDLLSPVELLHLYPHCLHSSREQKLTYFIETRQSDWLCDKLKPGDVALDVGAAFGVISVALSKTVGSEGHVYAFDPSRTAQKFLKKIIEFNNIPNISVVPYAISDTPGSSDFIEFTSDNDLSWASDASALATANTNPTMNHDRYQVEVTTLDDYVSAMGIEPKAIKIDIEGFELYALQGGKTVLEKFSPYLCIDIHMDVRTGESALVGVEPFLLGLGYKLEMEGHALYCTPKK